MGRTVLFQAWHLARRNAPKVAQSTTARTKMAPCARTDLYHVHEDVLETPPCIHNRRHRGGTLGLKTGFETNTREGLFGSISGRFRYCFGVSARCGPFELFFCLRAILVPRQVAGKSGVYEREYEKASLTELCRLRGHLRRAPAAVELVHRKQIGWQLDDNNLMNRTMPRIGQKL